MVEHSSVILYGIILILGKFVDRVVITIDVGEKLFMKKVLMIATYFFLHYTEDICAHLSYTLCSDRISFLLHEKFI